MEPTISYPQYRKYSNEKTYFKIISNKKWEEIQLLNKKYTLQKYEVNIFSDRNYLHDLTFDYKRNWMKIKEDEYEKIKAQIVSN